ncbi:ABC_6TM_YOR1_D2_like domain containing protein [Flavobacteriaceae bacterium]
MRKLFLVLASIFTALSIIFAYLPLGTLALIPIGIAILFGILALKKSDVKQQKVVKVILLFTILSLVFVVGKEIFTKDEVVIDKQFDTKKIESEKEAKKDLEDLEGL